MWKVIAVYVLLLCAGCRERSGRDSFDTKENVATVSSSTADFAIVERSTGTGRWVPLQDVTRTRFTGFSIEIKRRDKRTGVTNSVATGNLMKQSVPQLNLPPGFLGATTRYGFWSAAAGYFAVELETAKVSYITCNPKFMAPGRWEAVNEQTIRRRTASGVFEISVRAAQEIR